MTDYTSMKRVTIFKLAVLLATTLVIAACSSVAFTGRKRLLLFNDSQITSLSDQSYAELMNSSRLSTDWQSAAIIRQVGIKLTTALTKYLTATGQTGLLNGLNWEYSLVQSDEINAFCMPNGKIVFYEGIMPYCNTPDFVAVVMGHEIAHAIARHGNERMSQQVMLSVAGTVASEYIGYKTSAQNQELFNLAYSIGNEYGILLPFSRKHELEADEIGLILMALAGYDINQAPVFWRKMQAGSTQSVPEFFSTHPNDARRIASIEKEIPKVKTFVASIK